MDLKDKVKESKGRVKTWLHDHQGDIIYGVYITACIGGAVASIVKKSRRNSYNASRERTIYDPSLGFYWETKKPLTNNQKMMFEQRRKNGEPCGKILKDMGILKK